MTSLTHHLLTMAYNNAWANHRLLKACCHLSQAEFVATRTSFFPSIKATLNHSLTVDWYYIDALERSINQQPPNAQAWAFFEPEEPFDTCAELQREQRQVDQRLIALCRFLTDELLEQPVSIPRSQGIKHELTSRLLAHLFQHQIHHRGQAHAMLAGTAVEPPQLDEFFCADEAALRERDFQELGFSEQEIWGH
ncbi:DinB family protein [Nodosilinea sp. LEGE 06152]|uniref:DinB family protein n=1 Tax=Nodosilinea sp. LEGE 06152 TaxID=2777966 RepID=UPI001882EC1A|nr:DinB family protein [Nodosilinea sp. LEGE 06152]MBE9159016.1 DinB family protein [Nodosilinea sp. LEGE 06152]